LASAVTLSVVGIGVGRAAVSGSANAISMVQSGIRH
jgi:hypothetical protein